ncbi:MAG: TrkA family potassium uptake protein [Eubacteriales bacterium]|jgi:trk system potassium uptake protein TrkA|nr:TrkA family potassium uptake protein [Eubacteriales bacterium]MDD4105195.1 TrkA family potassium uptake protein [Eubacteriales bacterium]
MKSILIIGVGRFGRHLALDFMELGNEVMIVDQDEAVIESLSGQVTTAQIGDCKDEHVMRSLGVNNFDLCFVTVSSDFQSSLEVTSLLKECGAKYVVSKADREIHEKFLLRNGADEVIHPERDMARKASRRFSARNAFDYLELTSEYALFEIKMPGAWVGKSVRELAVRTKYGINVIATKINMRVTPLVNADHVFKEDEHLIITGDQKEVVKILERL